MQCACWEGLNSYRKRFYHFGHGDRRTREIAPPWRPNAPPLVLSTPYTTQGLKAYQHVQVGARDTDEPGEPS